MAAALDCHYSTPLQHAVFYEVKDLRGEKNLSECVVAADGMVRGAWVSGVGEGGFVVEWDGVA